MNNYDKEFLEIIGLYIGDGSIYETKNSMVFELRGNLNEKQFYDNYILKLFEKYLKKITIGFRSGGKNGCYGIRTCNKEFINKILNTGFKPGKKTETITLSKSLIELSKENKKYILRGLFASDGTAYLAKINNNKEKTYPIIEYSSKSKKLVNQIKEILDEYNIRNYIWNYKNKYGIQAHVRITGIKQCLKFQNEIGLMNPNHISRIKEVIK